MGAGYGRDAAYLANKGFSVVAVEPAEGMRSLAWTNNPQPNIHWIDDTLPELQKVFALQINSDHLRYYLSKKYGLNVAVHEPTLSTMDTSTWKITIEKFPNRLDLPSQKMHVDICALPFFEC